MKLESAFHQIVYAGITDSIQTVQRWVREGKIAATMETKKGGYDIDPESLELFIRNRTKPYERYFRLKFEKEYNIGEYKDKIRELENRLEIEQGKNKIHRATIKKLKDE